MIRISPRAIVPWATALALLLTLAALAGCEDKCTSLSPQVEIAIDFGGLHYAKLPMLDVTVRLGGKPLTRRIETGELFFKDQVGRFTLTIDQLSHVNGVATLEVAVTALDAAGQTGAHGSKLAAISADGCNFVTVSLGQVGGDGRGGDGGGAEARTVLDAAVTEFRAVDNLRLEGWALAHLTWLAATCALAS